MRPWLVAAACAFMLLAIHLWVTRGTGSLPVNFKHLVGGSAATSFTRPWAKATYMFFHESWFHIGYNLTVLMATFPFALAGYGNRAILLAAVTGVLVAFAVDLLVIAPLAGAGWSYAEAFYANRSVGASVMIFAGAGMAFTTWEAPLAIKSAVVAGYVLYEFALTAFGITTGFVSVFHIGGALMGIGWGTVLRG